MMKNTPVRSEEDILSMDITPKQKEKRTSKWCIDDFNIGRRLGEGSYSTVILVEEKKAGFLCALKVMKV